MRFQDFRIKQPTRWAVPKDPGTGWTNVKQAQQDGWVWTACETRTKLIPVLQLGPRSQEMAYAVVHKLKARLNPGCVPVFSSVGLKHYSYALTAHFGEWVTLQGESRPVWLILESFLYTQVITCACGTASSRSERRCRQTSAKVPPGEWETTGDLGSPTEYRSLLQKAGLSGNINTSFVELVHLTIRQCVSSSSRCSSGN